MIEVTTEELIDQYYEYLGENASIYGITQTKRPELFKFEQEIGKQLVEMDSDEIIAMLRTFEDLSERTIYQISSYYRNIIDFYIDKYHKNFYNPFHKRCMKGQEFFDAIHAGRESFTIEYVEKVIDKINKNYRLDPLKANWLECIIRLFLDGFANAGEIVGVKESDINFETNEITVPRSIIKVSSRTMELLKFIHIQTEYKATRITFAMEPWHGSYFKFIVRRSNADDFQMLNKMEVSRLISKRFSIDINKPFKVDIDAVKLYYLGLYLKFVDECGSKEKANEYITSGRDNEASEVMGSFMKRHDVGLDRVALLKRYFRIYV